MTVCFQIFSTMDRLWVVTLTKIILSIPSKSLPFKSLPSHFLSNKGILLPSKSFLFLSLQILPSKHTITVIWYTSDSYLSIGMESVKNDVEFSNILLSSPNIGSSSVICFVLWWLSTIFCDWCRYCIWLLCYLPKMQKVFLSWLWHLYSWKFT